MKQFSLEKYLKNPNRKVTMRCYKINIVWNFIN